MNRAFFSTERAKKRIYASNYPTSEHLGIIYYTTTCFHLQVIFFINQLTIHSLFFAFIKLIILKLYTAHCKLA